MRTDEGKTVADILVERLIDWGVDTIFGFPGDGINGIFEALRTNQEKIKFIHRVIGDIAKTCAVHSCSGRIARSNCRCPR